MNLKSIENEANLVNEPTASDLDAASRLGPTINKHLASLETLCKLIPDCDDATSKLKELRQIFAGQLSLQPNVLETPITLEQTVQHHSQKSIGHLENKLKDMGKSSASIDYNSIDKAMKEISQNNGVTPDDLHKLFVASHGGMTPDDYAKAVRDRSINESIFEIYEREYNNLGDSVWVAISNHLKNQGYEKTEIKEFVNRAIMKIAL